MYYKGFGLLAGVIAHGVHVGACLVSLGFEVGCRNSSWVQHSTQGKASPTPNKAPLAFSLLWATVASRTTLAAESPSVRHSVARSKMGLNKAEQERETTQQPRHPIFKTNQQLIRKVFILLFNEPVSWK